MHAEAIAALVESYIEGQIGPIRADLLDAQSAAAAAVAQVAQRDAVIVSLRARIAELEAPPVPPTPDVSRLPKSYPDWQTAATDLGLPTDRRYVVWSHGNQFVGDVLATLGQLDVLVLPERAEPCLLDTSKGFMASGVAAVDGPGGTRLPIVSKANHWFTLARCNGALLGLGPGAVVAPNATAWSQPAQPSTRYRYDSSGNATLTRGAQEALLQSDNAASFFANFTLRGRDLGGVAYSGIALMGGGTVKRLHADGCWRGFAGVPNGETGALCINRGPYLIDGAVLRSEDGPSPIMWNSTTAGGTTRNVRATKPNHGMLTFWGCASTHVFEEVHYEGRQIGVNLEETRAGFALDWRSGSLSTEPLSNGYHLNGNPVGGSVKVSLGSGVAVSGGPQPGKLTAHLYSTGGKQRKVDYTWPGGEIVYYSPLWI